MRVSCVQRCAGKKSYSPVALKEPDFCGMVESKYTFSIFTDNCSWHVTLRIERRGSWNGVSGDCELPVQQNMDIPLLNPYGLGFRRTTVDLFSFLILRACCY